MPDIIHLAETISTNQYIRERIRFRKLEEGSVVWTDFQTSGRGQLGNSWESERGCNLTFSVVVYPSSIPANSQFLISQIAALSVKETLGKHADNVTVKWPNDVYWKDKKICGILIENDLSGRNISSSILGIGINYNQEVFEGHAPNPVSLTQITGEKYILEDELHSFLEIFYNYYLLLLKDETDTIRQRYREALYRKDGFHLYWDENGVFEAAIYDIDLSGYLELQRKDGTLSKYAFKEVKCVITDNLTL